MAIKTRPVSARRIPKTGLWNGQVVDGQDTHECGRREGEKTERGDEKTERKPDAPRGGAEWEDGPPRGKDGRNFLTDGGR